MFRELVFTFENDPNIAFLIPNFLKFTRDPFFTN
jgi:hypothetical protein